MLPGLISWHIVSSLSSIWDVFASCLHDYAAESNLETRPNTFESRGWKVIRIWECELQKKNREKLEEKLSCLRENSKPF